MTRSGGAVMRQDVGSLYSINDTGLLFDPPFELCNFRI
jgi:hypothetical protein